VQIDDRQMANREDGENLVRLDTGLEVASFTRSLGTFVLTLENGAEITIRGAFFNRYQVGEGEPMSARDFNAWASENAPFTVGVSRVEIPGTTGPDNLVGTDAGENLRGRAGNDLINGRGGRDTLDGEEHDDQLTGGAGADTFVYRFDSAGSQTVGAWDGLDGQDAILDFSLVEGDRLRFIDRSGVIDTLNEFKAGFGTMYSLPLVTGANSLSFQFQNADNPDQAAHLSGTHGLEITLAESIGTSLYNEGTGLFNDADAFIEALGGADALLFG